MKRIVFAATILLVCTMIFSSFSHAFFRRGEINENYSYDNLKVEKDSKGKCWLTGMIVNKTGKRREDVRITFYAKNIHGDTYWRAVVKIDLIDRNRKFEFKSRIKKCGEENPLKWEFKVKDRNK